MPKRLRLILFLIIVAFLGGMLYFIFSGSKSPNYNNAITPHKASINAANDLLFNGTLPSVDPLSSPKRKAQAPKAKDHLITIESRKASLKPELINESILNSELTKIGFWDDNGISFLTLATNKAGKTEIQEVTNVTAKSLHIVLNTNVNPQEIYPDSQAGRDTLDHFSLNLGLDNNKDGFYSTIILHPYLTTFDYDTLGTRLSMYLLENIWNATQRSQGESGATGHTTGTLYALKVLKKMPNFSFIHLTK